MLLVLRHLEGDPRLARSFEALRADAEALGLLGTTVNWTGTRRLLGYDQAVHRLGEAPPPSQLLSLLTRLVDFSRLQARSPPPRYPNQTPPRASSHMIIATGAY